MSSWQPAPIGAVTRAVMYARVSSRRQAETGLGIDAQLEAGRGHARSRQWTRIEEVVDHCSGAIAPDRRQGLGPALQDLDYRGGVLVATSLSRHTREALDLLDRATGRGWHMAVLDLLIDTTAAAGRLMATNMAAMAQYEREAASERTSGALAQARLRGVRLGRPVETPAQSRARLRELRASGLSMQATAERLNEEDLPTPEEAPGIAAPSPASRSQTASTP